MNQTSNSRLCTVLALLLALFTVTGQAVADNLPSGKQLAIRDITNISGVRDNMLIGYGLVVGLKGTGDRQQTIFTTQALGAAMQRMGVQIPATAVRVNNIAAVFVTASLPPFSRAGMRVDVTASSIGDAKSLEGGVLLLTSLRGPDGQVFAEAQGPLVLGGYTFGAGANLKQVNHSTVGMIPEGAIIERDLAIDLAKMQVLSFILRNPDFSSATRIADTINHEFGKAVATAMDSRRVDVEVSKSGMSSVPALIARVQNLTVQVTPPAKVVVNERTGTIVMGGNVTLSAVAVLHGNLSIEVTTNFLVSQPNPFTKGGATTTVPEVDLKANDSPVRTIRMVEGASVEDLINGLHVIGASARDIVAILQAIKAAGGLQAELEIL